MILADNSTSKTGKHLQHMFRSLASTFQHKAIAQQQAERCISLACTPALGPGGDGLCSNELLGMVQ